MPMARSLNNHMYQKPKLTEIDQALQQLMRRALESSPSHGIQLYLHSQKKGLLWQGAVGFNAREDNQQRNPLNVDQPMRVASNTKTFAAAAILRLWEQQSINLDDPIEQYLSPQHTSMIRAAGYPLTDITLRHLLSHTSGLYDYGDSPEFLSAIVNTPQRHWTRTEQLKVAMASGQPYGNPGEVFRYSDTGYILLGEIIERVAERPLGIALRLLLDYQALGLNATWLETAEQEPPGLPPLVHQYEGDLDIRQLHASCDIYGGGGLVSTVGDMARFMQGLFNGNLFKHTFTLPTLLSTVAATSGGPDYGIWQQIPGTYRLGIDGGQTGRVFSHKGHFGTVAAYVPELDLAIGLNLNITRQGNEADQRDLMLADILALFGGNF